MSGKPIDAEDIAVLRRLQKALPDAGLNSWFVGVEVLGRVIKHLTAAQQQGQGQAVAWSVLRIGNYGAAYDPRGACRAFTYDHQPGNVDAGRLGNAAQSAATASAGDSIDRGLALLKALQEVGFGVFQIGAAQPMQQGGGEVIQRHVVTKYRDGSVHVADVAAPPIAPVGVLDDALLDRLAGEVYQVHCDTPIRPFPNDTHWPKWRAVVQHVANTLAQQPAAAPCCMCGNPVDTRENGTPGAELTDGRWTCSHECFDKATTQHQEPTT